MRKTLLVSCLSLAACPLAAQTTWIVDANNGPGTHFTTIQAAVDAASAGDTVLVRPVTAGYAGATIRKGLYLLGEGEVELTSALTITGVPARQSASVVDFTMRLIPLNFSEPFSISEHPPIVCRANAGSVHFERVRGAGSASGPGLTVEQSPHVSATDCVLAGGVSSQVVWLGIYTFGGDSGVVVQDSGLLLTRCSVSGEMIYDPQSMINENWPGMVVSRSRVVLVDGMATGGNGIIPGCLVAVLLPTPAVVGGNGSTIVIKGTSLAGGTAEPNSYCAPAPDLQADPTTTVIHDPRTLFTISGSPLVVPDNVHDLQTRGVRPGQVFSVTLSTFEPTPAPYALLAALPGTPVLPGIGIWLDFDSVVQLAIGTVNGTVTDQGTVPTFFPRGLPIALQSLLLVNGQPEVSTPAILTLH